MALKFKPYQPPAIPRLNPNSQSRTTYFGQLWCSRRLFFMVLLCSFLLIVLLNNYDRRPDDLYVSIEEVQIEQDQQYYEYNNNQYPIGDQDKGGPEQSTGNGSKDQDKDLEQSTSYRSKRATKLIIDWTGFFGLDLARDWSKQRTSCAKDCQFRQGAHLASQADAIVFHTRNIDWSRLPSIRTPKQRYVYFSQEAPSSSKAQDSYESLRLYGQNFFNWTMTYRKDSDLAVPYSNQYKLRDKPQHTIWHTYNNVSAKRTGILVWFVGNCHTDGKREIYFNSLSNYVKADMFGSCSRRGKCQLESTDCHTEAGRKYKFFIAMENGACLDYASEKLSNMWQSWMVPIVLNRAMLRHYNLPPKSIISIDDFNTTKQLANYLNYLDQNDTAYKEHHQWRVHYEPGSAPDSHYSNQGFCSLCEKLHSVTPAGKSVVSDIANWWAGPGICEKDYALRFIGDDS